MGRLVYVLRLAGGRYYVGKTSNLAARLAAHSGLKGSAWTRRYPFKALVESLPAADKFDEEKLTLRYMDQYGAENVRGGSYSNPELYEYQLKNIARQLASANDRCLKCGDFGHFITQCPF
jgi:hypothetical protein